ncbi:hypothetical protein BH09DEP1_BH09DEP1_6460 [soil metagenome]
MPHNNVNSAKAYYQALNDKNLPMAAEFLHPDITLVSPLGTLKDKDAVINSLKPFTDLFNALTIRAAMGSGDQVMLTCDLDCPAPMGLFKTAILLTFKEGLIYSSELFYDGRPLEKKKDTLFNQ